MGIQTSIMKQTLATAYGQKATHAAVYTTVPGAAAGTEPTGGTPAYARMPITWGAPDASGKITGQVTFDIPAGTSVKGAGFHDALSAGTYLDGGAVTQQDFATQGQYVLNVSYQQS